MAWSGHIWFLFHSMLGTVYVLFVLREPATGGLGLGTVELGSSYACAGVGAVLGGSLASRAGRSFDVGPTIVLSRAVMPMTWLAIVLARPGPGGVILVCAGQFLLWLALGTEGANEMGYRNAVTPGRLQGRMNTTIRSINRGAVVAGAPLGGLIADTVGYRAALWIGTAGLALAAAFLAASPFRRASTADALHTDRGRTDSVHTDRDDTDWDRAGDAIHAPAPKT